MKSKFSVFAFALMMFFSLSSSSPISESAKSALTSISPENEKQPSAMEKVLSSKVGKWAMKRMEKRHNRLSAKLAAAEKAGDVKKVERIKQKMSAKASLTRIGLWLMVGGLLALIIGFVIALGSATSGSSSGFGLGALLYVLGGLAFSVGVILLIIGLVQG